MLGYRSEEAVVVGKIKLTPRCAHQSHSRGDAADQHAFCSQVDRTNLMPTLNLPNRSRALCIYVSAGDVLPVLVQALTEPGTREGEPARRGARWRRPRSKPATATTTARHKFLRGAGALGGLGGTSGTATGGGSSLNISEELSTQPVDTTPQAVTVGNAKIIADQRANTIIVLGNREVVVKVQQDPRRDGRKGAASGAEHGHWRVDTDNNEEFGVD